MSSSNVVRPVVGQRIVVRTIYKGDEKTLLATSMGIAWPLHGVHYLRDSPREKRLIRFPPWRAKKVKLVYEGVASAMNVTVLEPDPLDRFGQLPDSYRIPEAHMKYFFRVEGAKCRHCGSDEVFRIKRFRQTAEVCRACNSGLPV